MKKSKQILILAILSALVTGLTGCLALSPTESCELGVGQPPTENSVGGAVVLFQASDNFPDSGVAIVQSEALRSALPQAEQEVPFALAIAVADGSPNLLFQSWINLDFGDIELDLEQKRNRAQAALGNVYGCSFEEDSSLGDLDNDVDLIGGLRVASSALANVTGEKLVLVFSNGFQTSGQPNFAESFPADFDEVDSIIDVLRNENALPDLKGVRVEWIGLGQITAGNEQLDQQAFNTLEYFWTSLISSSGGTPPGSFSSGALGNASREGAPSSLPLAEVRGLCLFSLDETAGFAFKPNSSSFVNEDLAKVGAESIARQIFEADCGNRPLRVTGFTASGKSKSQFELDGPNLALSEARARAFADILETLGLEVQEVVGGGKGPTLDWDSNGQFVEELGRKNRIVLVEEVR